MRPLHNQRTDWHLVLARRILRDCNRVTHELLVNCEAAEITANHARFSQPCHAAPARDPEPCFVDPSSGISVPELGSSSGVPAEAQELARRAAARTLALAEELQTAALKTAGIHHAPGC